MTLHEPTYSRAWAVMMSGVEERTLHNYLSRARRKP